MQLASAREDLTSAAGLVCFYALFVLISKTFSGWLLSWEKPSNVRLPFQRKRRTMSDNFELKGTTSVRKALNEEATLSRRGYTVGVLLGEGSYAQVYSCVDERRQRKCAMKIVNRRKAPADFLLKFLPRELKLLKKFKHCNIVQLYEIFEFGSKVYISMELAGHGDLLDYIRLRRYLSEDVSRNFFRQLLYGIQHLHKMNIVHRDLKCENILLTDQNQIKITDFGFARETGENEFISTFCGSAAYAAPEILQGQAYRGVNYDVWSLGIILYIMVCGSMPFDDSNINKMIQSQLAQKIPFTKKREFTDKFKALVFAILQPQPTQRLSIEDILKHDWVDQQQLDHIEDSPVDCNQKNIPRRRRPTVPADATKENRTDELQVKICQQKKGVQQVDGGKETPVSSRRRAAPTEVVDAPETGKSANKLAKY